MHRDDDWQRRRTVRSSTPKEADEDAHIPRVNARYWSAITFASLFGTDLGDLYAHEAHLGVVLGASLLAALAAVAWSSGATPPRARSSTGW